MINNSGIPVEVKRQHMQQLADYREQELRPHPKLHSLFFELTVKCNEHCRHCGSWCGDIKEQNALSLAEWKEILDHAKKEFAGDPRFRLCITGGEPLLYPHFEELLSYADELGIPWGMTSNGTLITPEIAAMLKRTRMRTISISVDGLEETHDWFRMSPGSYQKTLQGIQNLLNEKCFHHVQITTVVHHRNFHQLEEMYRTFSETGVHSWRVINVEPMGRAKDDPELELTPEQYVELFAFIREKRFAGPMEVSYGCSHYLGDEIEREVRPWYFLCNAGIYTASIRYNGDIGACLDIPARPETIQGNIRERSLKDVWENRFEIFRTDYRKVGKCADCEDYVFCAGDSFHSWDFERMEPMLCMRGIICHT